VRVIRENIHGQIFDMGKAYPQVIRENVLDLYNAGLSQREIGAEARVSLGFVNKIIKEYDQYNFSMPRKAFSGRQKYVISEDVMDYLENEKLNNPSIYTHELQARLLLDGVCLPHEVPSKTSVNRFFKEDLKMSQKRITQVPSESLTGPNIDRQNEFLDEVSRIDPCTLHSFDEASVIRTTGNRRFGKSYIGEPAIEFQRYASNANFTVNLLHSVMGVDHYSILDGPSNGTEMLLFFEDVLSLENPDGSTVLERGDTVVMDNCGFHHGRFAEGMLRDMFEEFGVHLLYQPPYCPHFNTCELCFHQMKSFLCRFSRFAQEETRLAIAEGIAEITQLNSIAYFRHCGYLV